MNEGRRSLTTTERRLLEGLRMDPDQWYPDPDGRENVFQNKVNVFYYVVVSVTPLEGDTL